MKWKAKPHFALDVRNYPEAIEFYENILGFEKIRSFDDRETGFKLTDFHFYMADATETAGTTYFEFQTENLSEDLRILLAKGCIVLKEFNRNSILLRDPYGMCFHLYSEQEKTEEPIAVKTHIA